MKLEPREAFLPPAPLEMDVLPDPEMDVRRFNFTSVFFRLSRKSRAFLASNACLDDMLRGRLGVLLDRDAESLGGLFPDRPSPVESSFESLSSDESSESESCCMCYQLERKNARLVK